MDQKTLVAQLLGEQVIAVRPSLIRVLEGDGNAAILLSQLLYRSQRDQNKDGWFYATGTDLQKETGLSRVTQMKIRNKLKTVGVVQERKEEGDRKVHFCINFDALADLLCKGDCKAGFTVVRKAGFTQEDTRETTKNTSYSAATRKGAKNFHVLGDIRHQQAVAWIVDNYPRNSQGLGATEAQAKSIVNRLGKLPNNFTEEDEREAMAKLNKLRKGIQNFRKAVEDGTYDRQFVFGFAKFAGLGVQYGDAPKYLTWAEMKPVQKKPTLEGVI